MELINTIAREIASRGGRLLVVGGFVRDQILGVPSKDYDCEIYGLDLEGLEVALGVFGEVQTVGRAFGVLRIKGLDIDFSLPRKDSKTGAGHRGFSVEVDPCLTFEQAALRRDLSVNSMGWDPLTDDYLDPHGGREDLRKGQLRATSPQHFPEDPLRGLRVAQFAARLTMQPDPGLVQLCQQLDLSELPAERLYQEFHKLLLKGVKPSMGLEFLRISGQLRFFPELEALEGVPQDPRWHPEGDVWVHTLLSVDAACDLRTGVPFEDEVLMFGVLCHDLGKPAATENVDGRIRSHRHQQAGLAPTNAFLSRLRASGDLVKAVEAAVLHHLAPSQFVADGAKAPAYRRLASRLSDAGISMTLLERVARADHLGRTTDDAKAQAYPAGDHFLAMAGQLAIAHEATSDVVQGRHLIAAGCSPGPEFGAILAQCREIQDETGATEPEAILQQALDAMSKKA